MTELEKMRRGEVYDCGDAEILRIQYPCLGRLSAFNATGPTELEKRAALLREMFAEIGSGCYIEPPLRANWGGRHVHFGDGVYANFNLTLVDDGDIYVGSRTMIGPNVTIATAGHPICPDLRARNMQFNVPVRIGENVWLGAGAILVPGVTVGNNAVIGAGSVVTKDVPPNVVAAGNPCRVLREIGARDRLYYYRDRPIAEDLRAGAVEPPR